MASLHRTSSNLAPKIEGWVSILPSPWPHPTGIPSLRGGGGVGCSTSSISNTKASNKSSGSSRTSRAPLLVLLALVQPPQKVPPLKGWVYSKYKLHHHCLLPFYTPATASGSNAPAFKSCLSTSLTNSTSNKLYLLLMWQTVAAPKKGQQKIQHGIKEKHRVQQFNKEHLTKAKGCGMMML